MGVPPNVMVAIGRVMVPFTSGGGVSTIGGIPLARRHTRIVYTTHVRRPFPTRTSVGVWPTYFVGAKALCLLCLIAEHNWAPNVFIVCI